MFYTRFGRWLIDGLFASEKTANPDIWTVINKLLFFDGKEMEYLFDDQKESVYDIMKIAFPLVFIGNVLKKNEKQNMDEIIANLPMFKHLDEDLEKVLKTQYFEDVYSRYLELRKTTNLKKLTRKEFSELYTTSFSVMLDSEESRRHDKASVQMHKLGLLLNNDLGEPKQRQYEICYNILREDKSSPQRIYENFSEKAHFYSDNEEKRKVIFNKLYRIVFLDLNPLEVLEALFLGKRTTLYTKGKVDSFETPEVQAANDIILENGLVYNLFTANALNPLGIEKQEENIIFCPSPFFIRKWHKDNRLVRRKVTFVVKDDFEAMILNYYFGRSALSGMKREEYSFLSFSEWCNKTSHPQYSNILLFRNSELGSDSIKIKDILDRYTTEDAYIYSISSEHSFYEVGDLSYDIANDMSFVMDSILRIPSKIGGKRPRRKVLWMARKKTGVISTRENCENLTWTCDTAYVCPDNQEKLIVIHSFNPHLFDFHAYLNSGESLRKYIENINSHPEKMRKDAKYVNFSREIRIWYSESRGIKDKNKVRLDVYVCNEVSEDQQEKRGSQNKDSLKRTGEKNISDVVSYVLNEYPYDHFSRRKDGKIEQLEIRDILGDFYKRILAEKAITLKTFVYIYPELKNQCSVYSYSLIEEMSKSKLGERVLELITYDDYLNYIQTAYPDNPSSYSEFMESISRIIDFAVDKGHVSSNTFEQTQQTKDKDIESRLAAQVRAALTKKSFTRSEFKTIYNVILHEIKKNIFSESIGILIRLFTGLKCSEVCALRWKDFCYIDSYDFYQLHVYARVSSNGKDIEPFKNKEEFRCIPIGKILTDILLKIKKETNPNENDFVVPNNDKIHPYNPKKLDKLGRMILEKNGICEDLNIVLVGKNKKSNLNKYFGDIYRENFHFHSVRLAKFNADEIAYFRGVSKTTTFGIYYCDYANLNSQAILYMKLRRLDTIILDESSIDVKVRRISDNLDYLFNRNSRYPIQLDIDIKPDDNGETELSIDSNYGLRIISEDENEFF